LLRGLHRSLLWRQRRPRRRLLHRLLQRLLLGWLLLRRLLQRHRQRRLFRRLLRLPLLRRRLLLQRRLQRHVLWRLKLRPLLLRRLLRCGRADAAALRCVRVCAAEVRKVRAKVDIEEMPAGALPESAQDSSPALVARAAMHRGHGDGRVPLPRALGTTGTGASRPP